MWFDVNGKRRRIVPFCGHVKRMIAFLQSFLNQQNGTQPEEKCYHSNQYNPSETTWVRSGKRMTDDPYGLGTIQIMMLRLCLIQRFYQTRLCVSSMPHPFLRHRLPIIHLLTVNANIHVHHAARIQLWQQQKSGWLQIINKIKSKLMRVAGVCPSAVFLSELFWASLFMNVAGITTHTLT